ncbi:MAG: beta-lactamase family protein [Planctomycetes bacterium]|nr:beta-lactamase family protein [Planctomycetota bacterium]
MRLPLLTSSILCLSLFELPLLRSGEPLPRAIPESQGVSSEQIGAFVKAIQSEIDSFHSFMLVRHGQVVAEGWWAPYDPSTRHELYSLSKSFTSTAVGLAIGENRFSLDDEVHKFFPEDTPKELSKNLQSMRVRDLLCMSTGHESVPNVKDSENWAKVFLEQKVSFKPGTHFLYNTPATYMLSAIVQKTTGKTTLEYLTPRLFEPLGIDSPTWDTCPKGISLGGYGLSVRTEDIAKFGQLYLQKGRWKEKQIIAPEWIEMATSKQTSNGSNPLSDWDQGYGFQFWRCRYGHFRGDGAFGQYCIVMPKYDAVLAITSGVKNMQAVLDLVWNQLIPAFTDAPLQGESSSHTRLRENLSNLALPLPKGNPVSGQISQLAERSFRFPENAIPVSSVQVRDSNDGGTAVSIRTSAGRFELPCYPDRWTKAEWRRESKTEPLAVAGAWKDPSTLVMTICQVETPFLQTWTMQFEKDQVTLTAQSNVGFGGTPPKTIVGTME